MKRLEVKIIISYHWEANNNSEIPEEHIEELKERAEERIIEMRKENYNQGDLYAEVYIENSDPEKHKDYSGWWHWDEERDY